MKKKNFKSLKLNKQVVTNFDGKIIGGAEESERRSNCPFCVPISGVFTCGASCILCEMK